MTIRASLQIALGFVLLLGSGCSSLRQPTKGPQLSPDERAAIAAILRVEARHLERPDRPILVLTPTDPSIPDDSTPGDDSPIEIANEVREQNAALAALRRSNDEVFDLHGIPLPRGVAFYPREEFERQRNSEAGFREFVHGLGGTEPLVLSISRPAILSSDSGAAILSVNATWSGCGGVNLQRLHHSRLGWVQTDSRGLVIW